MLPGNPEKSASTDQECERCGRYFTLSGYQSHRENCPVEESDYFFRDLGGTVTHNRCDCGAWINMRDPGATEHNEGCEDIQGPGRTFYLSKGVMWERRDEMIEWMKKNDKELPG